MDNDDEPVGRLLTRREMLKLLALVGAATAAGCAPRLDGQATPTNAPATSGPSGATTAATVAATPTVASEAVPSLTPLAEPVASATAASAAATVALPACVVRPEQTEGPFFLDEQLNRADIRSDPSDGSIRPGAPLALTFLVSSIAGATCAPLAGAIVDVWHCDAAGVYSGVNDRGFGSTAGQQFLRGYQVTGDDGRASFTTIYPGWYSGRATHIHFKIRTADGLEFTSQLYFDDALTDRVHAAEPYAARGPRDTLNANDGIFRDGGDLLTLVVAESGDGYAATFDIGLQM
jgi:protocatechuate 3,4-dioxygenase beta subunit